MSGFEAVSLPDEAKRALCEELLAEFAAKVRTINDRTGEMVHGCLVSPGLHKDQDRNPTASLNYKKLTYHCLGCGSSGGFLWFIATCRKTSSAEAREWLEAQTGLGNAVMEIDQILAYLDQLYTVRERPPMPTYSARVLAAWDFEHPYLIEARGVHPNNLAAQMVGWDEETDRITLPHFWKGKLVGWQTRKMPPEWRSVAWTPKPLRDDGSAPFDVHSAAPGSPKYHSSPDFPKDQTIYNYRPTEPKAYPVESMLSTIRHLHKLHMPATFGATITETQIKLLAKYDWLGMWFDNDKAGWTALEGRPAQAATKDAPAVEEKLGLCRRLAEYTDVWVVPSPWVQDAGDLPTEEAVGLAAQAVPWTLWKRPEVLYCFECKNRAHDGTCRS